MVLLKANADSEAGVLPGEELLTAMGDYNEQLRRAGVLLSGEGLQSSANGARIQFFGTQRTVTRGPFSNPKELVAGFWIFQTNSLDEAIDWIKRCPNPMGDEAEMEIRQIFEASDFGPEFTSELRDAEETLRAQTKQ